jgi:NADPH2:quinone reductase
MKAWLLNDFHGLDQLHLTTVPDPTAGHNEVVVDLEYAALNPADRYLPQGEYPAHPKLPHILGRDGVGIVSALGTGVERFHIGQRVLIIRGDTGVSRWGTLAQHVSVSVDSLAIPPPAWTVQQSAGAALVYLTAWQALTQWGDLLSSSPARAVESASQPCNSPKPLATPSWRCREMKPNAARLSNWVRIM